MIKDYLTSALRVMVTAIALCTLTNCAPQMEEPSIKVVLPAPVALTEVEVRCGGRSPSEYWIAYMLAAEKNRVLRRSGPEARGLPIGGNPRVLFQKYGDRLECYASGGDGVAIEALAQLAPNDADHNERQLAIYTLYLPDPTGIQQDDFARVCNVFDEPNSFRCPYGLPSSWFRLGIILGTKKAASSVELERALRASHLASAGGMDAWGASSFAANAQERLEALKHGDRK